MSPAAPLPQERPHPATDAHAAWIDSVLEADLGAPRKQRHTARRIYDRLVAERGYGGSYSSVRRHVAAWRREHARGGDGYLELEWAPGTAQADFGNFRAVLAGVPTDLKLLVVTLPHSNARYCVATMSERSECLCDGLASVFAWMGRAPHTLVLDNATGAGRMSRGKVTESELFGLFRAHFRVSSRYCNPYSGNEKGSVENAVGFLRRNLLVPEPRVGSLAELGALLRFIHRLAAIRPRPRQRRGVATSLVHDLHAAGPEPDEHPPAMPVGPGTVQPAVDLDPALAVRAASLPQRRTSAWRRSPPSWAWACAPTPRPRAGRAPGRRRRRPPRTSRARGPRWCGGSPGPARTPAPVSPSPSLAS